jgi:hypothetical protein
MGCAFYSNDASQFGGGVYSDGLLTVTNCTFFNNSALRGGGLLSRAAGGASRMTLRNCTITGNRATDNINMPGFGGGGVFAEGNNQQYFAANNIISENAATNDPDVRGNFTSQGHNLIGVVDDSTGWGATGDLLGANALFGAFANFGGQTFTFSIGSNSPARDAGFARVGVSDIGAFEFGASPPPTPSPTPTATATPTPSATPTPVTALANISTRLKVETGDNVLIGGFIVTGTQPKKVIIRGIGTSLPLADKLANPTLELHGPSGLIESNDNWVDSPNKQAIIDSTIPPSNDLESAIVQTLPANNAGYTAILRGVNGGTGIGVVEAYDLDTGADSRLANISTRGFVQTGDNVLIAGTIVVGQAPQRVIIRAIGPSLPIVGKMENPTLELRDSNGGLLQANDNWVDSPDKQAIIDTTIPPAHELESAIVATLPANNASYTAIVRGVNDTIGIAVVEVYALH